MSGIVVLGAGFGGLELATVLSDELGEEAGVTLIDASASFVFGYAKLDVMFGRTASDAVRLPYSSLAKPGVRLVRETVTAIDPEARRLRIVRSAVQFREHGAPEIPASPRGPRSAFTMRAAL